MFLLKLMKGGQGMPEVEGFRPGGAPRLERDWPRSREPPCPFCGKQRRLPILHG